MHFNASLLIFSKSFFWGLKMSGSKKKLFVIRLSAVQSLIGAAGDKMETEIFKADSPKSG